MDDLKKALVELDVQKVPNLVMKALSSGFDPVEILEALHLGMDEIGRRFENREYFVSELVMAGELMKNALHILKPHLKVKDIDRGKIVLGTIIGDLHDIGKEIVKSLLISAGFEVYDLGVDVSPERFVEKARETGAKIIGVSALLSTSAANTADVVKALEKAGVRKEVKIIVGGAAARPWMVEKYGVDSAVCDAIEGIEIIKRWAKENEPT